MKIKSLERKYKIAGWYFVMPASLLIFLFSFIPMVRAFILSLQSGVGNNLSFCGIKNYVRLFQDEKFIASLKNVIIYFAFQVPIMLFIAIILACILNDKKLKFKGLFRTIIFLPCATSLVASALIFKSLFALDGLVNVLLVNHHFISQPINWLTHPVWAKVIVIFTITWRWTGYNTVFFLAGLQGIEYSIYEAARIDGASTVQTFFRITLPQLKPVVLLTAIMSTNGTLQLFDEVKNLTGGGPGNATITISQYIYDLSFKYNPQFGYAAAVSYAILIIVALLSFIQIILADRKEK
ncbi:MAG: sugar ABC transporter permease [Treponema succinifaciens]|uniref:carbohydrate ABC transporter permease n=1 Tax=Treponema TaxID=157 RepID=UPI0023F17FB7|nr:MULTISPECIES: sugar ABC transporter permease [Treponema]MDD6962649.1 sugar ABC transporter permease [Treponema succinifaciens]MDY5117410.1 sugar ABC transporter permease [Treponema succinifaciens]